MEPWPPRSSGRSWRSASAAGLTWSGGTARSSARGAGSKRAAARARRPTAGRAARNLARVSERYTETAIHFDVERLPPLLSHSLPAGPLALADLGCGDGPLFAALSREGLIDATRPVYAVDLEAARLARVSARFPWIVALVASADSCPRFPTDRSTPWSRRWSWSTSPTSRPTSWRSIASFDPAAART